MLEPESINATYLAAKTEDDRAKVVLKLIDQVDAVLGDAQPALKVLVALRVASTWSIANGVQTNVFANAAGRVFIDTMKDLQSYVVENKDAPEDLPK